MLWWPKEIPLLQSGSIQSGAVTLRPLQERDIESVFRACQDPLIPQFTRVISPYTPEDAADFVRSSPFLFTERRAIQFAIECNSEGDDNSTRQFAGAISLHTIKISEHSAELGYWMDPNFRGRNICTIAAQLVTDFGINSVGFNRIEALVDYDNIASQRVLEKAAFVKEGLLRKKVTKESGTTTDMYIYSRISER